MSARHIAVVLGVEGDPELEREVVFWVEACRIQMRDHIAPAWARLAPPPGIFYYSSSDQLADETVGCVVILRDAGVDGAAGLHSIIGRKPIGVVDLSRSALPSRTLSHEIAEMYGNPYLDRWYPMPNGWEVAAELGDPVQRSQYNIDAEILGQHRDVVVSDFVTPAYFDPGASGPRSHQQAVDEPFGIAPGGYLVARNDGQIIYLPAKGEGVHAAAISRPFSRTAQLAAGTKIPRPAGESFPSR